MSSNVDAHVASILDTAHPDSEDEDALFDALENDEPALDTFREQRLQQLHSEFSRAKSQKNAGFGAYTTISSEQELMELTASCPLTVVHFSKEDFARCGTMDGHLEVLAKKHTETRFLKIDVGNAPFLTVKLGVKVLPCVIAWVEGKSRERIVGFEGLGYSEDTFTTKDLEGRLLACGVLVREKVRSGEQGVKWGVKKERVVDDDDEDWD